jgi:hypothetical protein
MAAKQDSAHFEFDGARGDGQSRLDSIIDEGRGPLARTTIGLRRTTGLQALP